MARFIRQSRPVSLPNGKYVLYIVCIPFVKLLLILLFSPHIYKIIRPYFLDENTMFPNERPNHFTGISGRLKNPLKVHGGKCGTFS